MLKPKWPIFMIFPGLLSSIIHTISTKCPWDYFEISNIRKASQFFNFEIINNSFFIYLEFRPLNKLIKERYH